MVFRVVVVLLGVVLVVFPVLVVVVQVVEVVVVEVLMVVWLGTETYCKCSIFSCIFLSIDSVTY